MVPTSNSIKKRNAAHPMSGRPLGKRTIAWKQKQIWLWLQLPRNSIFTLTHGHIFHCLSILENFYCWPKYRSLAWILSKISIKAKSLFLANNFSINQGDQSFLANERHKPTTYLTGDDFDCLKLATKTGGQKSKIPRSNSKEEKRFNCIIHASCKRSSIK